METTTHLYRGIYGTTESIWWYSHLKYTAMEHYDKNEKGWCIRFDDEDDDKMSNKYILSVILTWMGQLNT